MADMDSPAARSRQNPSSLRRNTKPAPRRRVRNRGSKPSPSGGNLARKRRAVKRSAPAPRRRTRSSSSNNDNSVSRRRSTIRRRIKSRQPTRSKPPTDNRPKLPVKPKPPVKPPVKKPPLTPEQQKAQIEAYLRGDSTYQGQLANFNKSLADFQSEQGLSRTDYDTTYQNNYRDIGLARDEGLENLENDFAARGLLHSSMYNQETGDLRSQYQNQYNDLGEQRTSFLDQLAQDLARYKNEQTVGKQNARAEAIRRRAEKQGI